MARKYTGNMAGERYLGDRRTMAVHDLEPDGGQPDACGIDAIIQAGNDVPFVYLGAAHNAGYDNCRHCVKRAPEFGSSPRGGM